MAESKGNNPSIQSGQEKVISILVIKEEHQGTPVDDKSTLKNLIDTKGIGHFSSGNGAGIGTHFLDPDHKPLYESQSFIINAHLPNSNIELTPQLIKNESSTSMEYETSVNKFLYNKAAESSSINQTCYIQERHTEDKSINHNVSIFNTNLRSVEEDVNYQKTVKLGRHKSISFPVQPGVSSTSLPFPQTQNSTALPNISSSSSGISPRILEQSSSLPYSPVMATSSSSSSSQNNITAADPTTPSITTTPDSGFYTPSQFEPNNSSTASATINPFFTSTPRRTKSADPQTSTPCLSDTPKERTGEPLQQKFTNLFNAMEWDSLDDSGGVSEDPKEGEDNNNSGEGSPNSSLRSVQWLKGFSIGDSVKPLISTPPTPGCKNQHLQYAETSSTISSSSSTATASLLTPLPVIMAPRIPTYLQTQQHITSLSSSSSSSSTSSSLLGGALSRLPMTTVSAQDINNSSMSSSSSSNISGSTSSKRNNRKALEELKMNKPERNIGRSKYTGKIFSRPGYSYMDLIKMAMQTSEEGEMTLKQIITWIEDHFPFFKHEAKDSWKSSIRHNLSLHSDFMKADDKKHGCKWKLCSDVAQPNLHVPAPQEMTSVQSAFLKKVKRNAPHPILPKMNTYALVPIHNLTNPVADGSQQQQQEHQQLQQQVPLPLPRKPVHILPKQTEESVQSVQTFLPLNQEEGQNPIPDSIHHHHHYQSLHQHQPHHTVHYLQHHPIQQETPSQQHQVIHQLLQKGPQQNCIVSGLLEDQQQQQSLNEVADVYGSNDIPAGIYQSSDSNSSHSMGFPSLNSFDQSLPLMSHGSNDDGFINNTCTVSNAEVDLQGIVASGSFSFVAENENSMSSVPDHFITATSSSVPQVKNPQNNFPLNSVVEIRQEEGAKPGEKKIVFVLQDSENNKRHKAKSKKLELSTGSNDAYRKKSSKNLSEIFDKHQELATATKTSSKSYSLFGKKKSKDGQRNSKQRRGPVMNLQSVLQNTSEDKKASDTIGRLLQAEDEEMTFVGEERAETDGFTRVKSFSERESIHLNSHMQRALQEQSANIIGQSFIESTDKDVSGILQENINCNNNSNDCFEKLSSRKQIISNSSSKLLPFSNYIKKDRGCGLKDRMSIIKNRNVSMDGFDLNDPNPSPILSSSKRAMRNSLDSSSALAPCSSTTTTPSASQLVFRRLSSSDQSQSSLSQASDSSHSFSSSNLSSMSDNKSSNMDYDGGSTSTTFRRRVGNILRSKSRRKQIHVPLTSEVSPARKSRSMLQDDDDDEVIIMERQDKKASFMTIDDGSFLQTKLKTNTEKIQQSVSLSTEIQKPSLDILQQKPLERYNPHTSLKEKVPIIELCDDSPDISHQNNFLGQSPDVADRDIEKIFVCSGSPVKNNVFHSSNENTVDNLFSVEFDNPPSTLHFLSTFPAFGSQITSDNDDYNNKASNCDDLRVMSLSHSNNDNKTNPHSHSQSISSSLSSYNFLETPSPPPRYLSSSRSSSTLIHSNREASSCQKSYGLLSLSPFLPTSSKETDNMMATGGSNAYGASSNSNSVLSWNNMMPMHTPPCGTRLHSPSASSKLKSPSTSVSSLLPSTVIKQEIKSLNETPPMLVPHHSIKEEEKSGEQKPHEITLPLFTNQCLSSNENDEHALISSVHFSNSSLLSLSSSSSSTSLSATAKATSCIDLASSVSHSLTTPPCGRSISDNSSSTNATIRMIPSSTLVRTATQPVILSALPSYSPLQQQQHQQQEQLQQRQYLQQQQQHQQQQNQQHHELFPNLPPETLSSLLMDPSIFENLDSFINSLPGYGSQSVFPSMQLSPRS